MAIDPVTVKEVQEVTHAFAKRALKWDEPIPDFATRRSGILESCLQVPFQQFERKHAYKGLVGKAAILFYLMVKNHPFQNGNKRVAVTTLLYFLLKNEKWLKVDQQEFYNFAKWVAESNPKVRKQTVEAIKEFIEEYLTER